MKFIKCDTDKNSLIDSIEIKQCGKFDDLFQTNSVQENEL